MTAIGFAHVTPNEVARENEQEKNVLLFLDETMCSLPLCFDASSSMTQVEPYLIRGEQFYSSLVMTALLFGNPL